MMYACENKAASLLRLLAVGGVLCLVAACGVHNGILPDPPSSPSVMRAPDAKQQIFATPEAAVDALVSAARNGKQGEVQKILGARADRLIHSGDKVEDRKGREKFIAAYDRAHKIESEDNGRDILVVGEEEWPMPIPLVHAQNGWWFDTTAGEQEVLSRRIGRNELNVIEVCRTYVEAQEEFAAQHPVGKGHEYAQRFQSSAGKHDGLYWPVAAGQPESPFGDLIADAMEDGYKGKALSKHTPFQGYYFRILKRQGPNAAGGAKDYVEGDHMAHGFAMIAYPARYGDSGVMTFIVNKHGIVYEKNLGPNTVKTARGVTQFDPDGSWNIVR